MNTNPEGAGFMTILPPGGRRCSPLRGAITSPIFTESLWLKPFFPNPTFICYKAAWDAVLFWKDDWLSGGQHQGTPTSCVCLKLKRHSLEDNSPTHRPRLHNHARDFIRKDSQTFKAKHIGLQHHLMGLFFVWIMDNIALVFQFLRLWLTTTTSCVRN